MKINFEKLWEGIQTITINGKDYKVEPAEFNGDDLYSSSIYGYDENDDKIKIYFIGQLFYKIKNKNAEREEDICDWDDIYAIKIDRGNLYDSIISDLIIFLDQKDYVIIQNKKYQRKRMGNTSDEIHTPILKEKIGTIKYEKDGELISEIEINEIATTQYEYEKNNIIKIVKEELK